jgi:hypothetical protein
MDVKLRSIRLSPTASSAFGLLSIDERRLVQKTLDLLEHPVSQRPKHLIVFRSRTRPKQFIVKVNPSLRIVYHKMSPRKLLVDDIYKKSAVDGLLGRRSSK